MFIRPDSELIRESVCACAKLFVDEENVGCANNQVGTTNLITQTVRVEIKYFILFLFMLK
jgi:hypothetical protein